MRGIGRVIIAGVISLLVIGAILFTAYGRAQVDFLERHLDKWVSKLDDKIQKRIKEPFYRGVSSFLREFLSNHLSYLCKNVSYPAGTAKS